MTSRPRTKPSPFPRGGDQHAGRLALKPNGPATGHVDGAWWPRSRHLGAELPGLNAGLAERLGRLERVSYNLDAWDVTARKLAVGGALVRAGGFRGQHHDTVDVLGAGRTLTLLVVPPETPADAAQHVLQTAATPGNDATVEELLVPTSRPVDAGRP
jgi:hypothetical protein